MGLFDDMFKKHKHRHHDSVVKELLDIIQKLENNLLLCNAEVLRLIKDNEKLYSDLQKCLNSNIPKPHGARFDVIFS
jgi:hypothetical protein